MSVIVNSVKSPLNIKDNIIKNSIQRTSNVCDKKVHLITKNISNNLSNSSNTCALIHECRDVVQGIL